MLVDIGPGAGDQGGMIMAQGSPEEVMKSDKSITGKYLSGKLKIDVPKTRRKGNKKYITILGAEENNLKNRCKDSTWNIYMCNRCLRKW